MKFRVLKNNLVANLKRRFRKVKGKHIIIVAVAVLTIGIGTTMVVTYGSNNKDVVVKEFDKDDLKKKDMYLEVVDSIYSNFDRVKKLAFCESQMRVRETFGYDKDDNITLESVYDVAFAIDLSNIKKGIKVKDDIVEVCIDRGDISLYKCEQISDIEVLDKKESFLNKAKDIFKNDDADLLHKATNRLNEIAKEEAQDSIEESELRAKAELTLEDHIYTLTKMKSKITIIDGGK